MFSVGDIVYLVCGSRAMVATALDLPTLVQCEWHDDDGVPQVMQYPESVLSYYSSVH